MVFVANIHSLVDMPESEMAEVRAFDALPENVTYPAITPELFAHLEASGGFDKVLEGKAQLGDCNGKSLE